MADKYCLLLVAILLSTSICLGAHGRQKLSIYAEESAESELGTAAHQSKTQAKHRDSTLMLLNQVAETPSAAEVPAVAETALHKSITEEFNANTGELHDDMDSLKHVSYRWKQPAIQDAVPK